MGNLTYKRVAIFREIGGLFLRNAAQNKLHYAVKKMIAKTEGLHEEFIDKQTEIKVTNASVDKEKNLIMDKETKEYAYTADNFKKMNSELRLLSNTTVFLHPHFVIDDQLPADLTFQYAGSDGKYHDLSDYDVRLAFEDFVLEPSTETE